MSESFTNSIVEAIQNNRAVAFIGAGASMSAQDPDSGISYNGLPGAGKLVKLMSAKNYISSDMQFNEACFLFKEKEGKQSLIKFFEEHLNSGIPPLPSHRLLAQLPFQMYISYNFDTLLEQALREVGRKYRTILDDNDISLLRDDEVAIIKPHGCFSKSDTIVASIDDELPFNEKFPLIDCFLKSHLASRTVVYIGFSLKDADFKNVQLHLQKKLGDIAPTSYAVFLNPSDFEKEYWKKNKVTIISKDGGRFLKNISNELSKKSASELSDVELDDWFSHPFFIHLQQIKNLPTETQLIDAFLDKLIIEVAHENIQIPELVNLALGGRTKVLEKKSNFEAFSKTSQEIIDILNNSSDFAQAETGLKKYLFNRQTISNNIGNKHNSVISKNDCILLFSQSKRVSQLLSAVPSSVQRLCKLYIAECRPKSPGHSFFQDSIETITHIDQNNYEIIFYPDIILGHLFENKLITKVIMGAHTVYVDDKKELKYFVNTSGSSVISNYCKLFNVPLFLIADSDKEVSVDVLKTKTISVTQEVKLDDSSTNKTLKDLSTRGYKIKIMNVGYDLVESHSLISYINEK